MDTTKTITHIGLCAGYGGIELGLHRVIRNLRTVALCEVEAFCCANLAAKMEAGLLDAAPIWTDLKTFPWADFRDRVDILTGGYPCQPFSAAGKRLGTDDPRHLWPFIADGIRLLRPRLCYFENVEGHISLGLREVVGELEQIGYSTAWGIFSASEVGAPHQRKRVFILAYDQQQGLEGLSEFCPSLCRSNKRSFIGNGCSREELANDSSAGLQGNFSGLFNANGARGWEDRESSESWAACTEQPSSDSRGGESGQIREGQAWPSRPGEQQYEWEPPRVVGKPDELRPQGCHDTGSLQAMGISRAELAGASGKHNGRQAQPALGRDADGSAGGLGYAELQVSCDNRTDELRLLGNGVVPATAERAFRILIEELFTMEGQE